MPGKQERTVDTDIPHVCRKRKVFGAIIYTTGFLSPVSIQDRSENGNVSQIYMRREILSGDVF